MSEVNSVHVALHLSGLKENVHQKSIITLKYWFLKYCSLFLLAKDYIILKLKNYILSPFLEKGSNSNESKHVLTPEITNYGEWSRRRRKKKELQGY